MHKVLLGGWPYPNDMTLQLLDKKSSNSVNCNWLNERDVAR